MSIFGIPINFCLVRNGKQRIADILPNGITADDDGKLRWTYELNMWRHPVMLPLFGLFYLLLCLLYRGRDVIIFEMDEEGVLHIQAP